MGKWTRDELLRIDRRGSMVVDEEANLFDSVGLHVVQNLSDPSVPSTRIGSDVDLLFGAAGRRFRVFVAASRMAGRGR
jgi:hypothetical protein